MKKDKSDTPIELTIQASEEKYHTLFDSNRDSITIFRINSEGKSGNFIEANPATTAIFGYTKDEILSMCPKDLEVMSDNKRKKRIENLLSKGSLDFETVIKNQRGNLRNVEIKSVVIDYLNEPAVMNITRDITERKQLELRIQKAHSNLETILEAIPDLLFEVGFDGRIHHYQAHREDLLSVPPAMFLGKLFQEVLPPHVAKICMEAIGEADKKGWSSGKQYELELTHGKKWFELSVSPIKESNSIEKHFIILARDITERKMTEIALQENEEKLKVIFNSVSESIYVIDKTGTFIDVNKGAEKMYKYSQKQLIGKSPFSLAAPNLNNLEEVQRKMESVSDTGNPEQFEFWAMRKNGEIFPKEVVVNKTSYSGEDYLIATARDITKRKKIEEALRKSDEKIMSVFNLANSGILLTDTNGAILEFNNWWLEKLNYSKKEFSQMTNLSITHPDDLEKSKLWLNKIITGEIEKYQIEKRYLRKDKSFFWGELSVSAIKDKNNKTIQLIGIITDITERKIAENSLRESEEKYRGLVENSPDGIVIYVDDKITFINDEGLRMLGTTKKEDIIKKPVLQFVHPDSLQSVIKRMEEVVADSKASKIVEERFISLDGIPFDVEIKAIPTIYEQKNAVQVIVHDITERKRTQEKIKQLSQAVEQSPAAIVITNTTGTIEYINPKFSETTGYSLDEVIGQNSRILKSGKTSPSEYIHLWQTITAGNEWFGEFLNKKKDGTLYWESASISPIFNDYGKTTHYIAIKEDITERKLVEQQLIKAKEKAEENDRLKLSFLANMSHEIRTPMNGILGFTELLKEPNLDSVVQQEYIKIIEKSGIRMLNIINDIISISKIESGQVEVTLTETNINEQIEYLHTFFKPEATHKGIRLLITNLLPSNENTIKTDCEKVYAILTNLVKNALKFTNSGSIEFGCKKNGANLEFIVKDTGLGISNSQKKIIFERFRQANDTISRSHEGSGLGLAISKAYVEKLGGKIWVESQERKGSSFYFTIPCNTKIEQNEKIASKKVDVKEKTVNQIKDLKILIVEDDSISKLLITIAVKPFSKEILKVSTGFEAIEACRNNPDIDLVMMDINMPEMGGYEATKQIRKFNKDLVIIAQTANGMQSDRDEAITAGCSDYISKPININILSELIQKYFEK